MWQSVTWEQFARASKFLVGLIWGSLELGLWGGRPYPLLFIAVMVLGSEAAHLLHLLHKLQRDSR